MILMMRMLQKRERGKKREISVDIRRHLLRVYDGRL